MPRKSLLGALPGSGDCRSPGSHAGHRGTYSLILRSGGVVVAQEQIHLADQPGAGPCGTVHVITIKPLTVQADGKPIDTPPHPEPYATGSSAP